MKKRKLVRELKFPLNLSRAFQNTPQLAVEMNGIKMSFLRGLIPRRKVRDLFLKERLLW